jgi:hypothetical protein
MMTSDGCGKSVYRILCSVFKWKGYGALPCTTAGGDGTGKVRHLPPPPARIFKKRKGNISNIKTKKNYPAYSRASSKNSLNSINKTL